MHTNNQMLSLKQDRVGETSCVSVSNTSIKCNIIKYAGLQIAWRQNGNGKIQISFLFIIVLSLSLVTWFEAIYFINGYILSQSVSQH